MVSKRHSNRVVVANSKGGVGKTTTVGEMAAQACLKDKRVLIVDMDPQGNATRLVLGNTPEYDELTIFDLLKDLHQVEINSVVREAADYWGKLWVIPANKKLEDLHLAIAHSGNWITYLDEVISSIEDNFDLILMDTGPNTSMLTRMAIRAANKMLIPVDPSTFCREGVDTMDGLLEYFVDVIKHELDERKVMMTAQHKSKSSVVSEVKKELRAKYGKDFIDVELPHCVKVWEGQREEQPLPAAHILSSTHKLNKGYASLTKRFLR